MQVTLIEEFRAMLWMLLCGILCGIEYDAVCVLRVLARISTYTTAGTRLDSFNWPLIGPAAIRAEKKWKTAALSFWIAAGDILFAGTAACTFCLLLSHALYGICRWFCLLAAVLGYIGYRQTAGKLVIGCSEVLAGIIRIILRYCLWLVLLPLRCFVRITVLTGKSIQRHWISPLKKRMDRIRKQNYTKKIQASLLEIMTLSEKEAA